MIVGQIQYNTSTQDIDRHVRLQPAPTLERLYARVMKQIIEQTDRDATLGIKVLSELLRAQRPMTTKSLLDAIAKDAGWERTYDQVQLDKRIERCVQCCKGLVARSDGDVVRLVHYTAREAILHFFSTLSQTGSFFISSDSADRAE
jgi:hypothetical protein